MADGSSSSPNETAVCEMAKIISCRAALMDLQEVIFAKLAIYF